MSFVSETVRAQRELYSAEKGLIVHSSSFEKNGFAFVCGGVCTAGKSTLCFKLKELFNPINDDRNLLEFTDDGLIIKSFWDQNEQNFSTKQYLVNNEISAKLKAFLFVAKEFEKETYLEKLSDKALIWKRLLFCAAPHAEGENQLFGNYFSMLEKLMSQTEFFIIHHNLKDPPEFVADRLLEILDEE